MAWYRSCKKQSGGVGTLSINPYNSFGGTYSVNDGILTYTTTAQSGYEGLSVQLTNLVSGRKYMICFDVKITAPFPTLNNTYSWKTCVVDGSVTDYSGDTYGKNDLKDGQQSLPKNTTKKSYGFYVDAQSSFTTLLFLTAAIGTNSSATFTIDNFKVADVT